jgi:hypothetical protein
MQQVTAIHDFSNACKQFLFSLTTDRPLTESEAQLVACYCAKIVAEVAPSLSKRSAPTDDGEPPNEYWMPAA